MSEAGLLGDIADRCPFRSCFEEIQSACRLSLLALPKYVGFEAFLKYEPAADRYASR
jgi:hypothetical protein